MTSLAAHSDLAPALYYAIRHHTVNAYGGKRQSRPGEYRQQRHLQSPLRQRVARQFVECANQKDGLRRVNFTELSALALDKDRADWLKKEAARARTAAAKKEKKADRLNRKLERSSEKRQQNVRRNVRQGLAEAMAEVGQANDAVNAFGGGYDADANPSVRR